MKTPSHPADPALPLWVLTVLCLLLFLLAGCKPEGPPADELPSDRQAREAKEREVKARRLGTNVVEFDAVRRALAGAGVREVLYVRADDYYVTPDRRWIGEDLTARLRTEFYTLGLLSPVGSAYAGRFDCDDFADGAAFLAQAEARARLPIRAGVVFGVIYYDRDGPEGRHAINFSLTRDAGLIFYEPQRLTEVTLSATELKSVDFWRF